MKKLTQEELNEIVRKHKLWLKSGEEGERADLSNCDLREAILEKANLRGANLFGANLKGANLFGANLEEANLSTTNLKAAVLSRANLMGANLRWANLRWANLKRADLRGADLLGAKMEGTDIIRFNGLNHQAYFFPWNKDVMIGCRYHTLEHWLENYVAIGEKNGYSNEEIMYYETWLWSLV